jgi:tRNA(adenine34) deaminase
MHRKGMVSNDDIQFLRLAIQQGRKGEQTPGGAPVGAVLVKDSLVAASGFNEGDLKHDPTAHAEMVVIRRLCSELKTTTLAGYTLYCTLQPCGMCTMACLWAGVSRIVYGAGRDDVNSVYFESRHFDTSDFIRQAFRDDMEIEGGVLSDECSSFYIKKEESEPSDPAHQATKPPT